MRILLCSYVLLIGCAKHRHRKSNSGYKKKKFCCIFFYSEEINIFVKRGGKSVTRLILRVSRTGPG